MTLKTLKHGRDTVVLWLTDRKCHFFKFSWSTKALATNGPPGHRLTSPEQKPPANVVDFKIFFSSWSETDLIERRRRVPGINKQLLTAKELMPEFSSSSLPGSTHGWLSLRPDPTRPVRPKWPLTSSHSCSCRHTFTAGCRGDVNKKLRPHHYLQALIRNESLERSGRNESCWRGSAHTASPQTHTRLVSSGITAAHNSNDQNALLQEAT